MSRRISQSPFTLFSFQDIITSVTGIILLLTLILSLELTQRKVSKGSMSDAEMADTLRQSIETIRQEVARLEPALAQGARGAEELAGSSVNDLKRQSESTHEQILRLQAELENLKAKQSRMLQQEQESLAKSFEREADRERLEILKEKAQEARDKIAELRRSNSLIYNPDPGTGKRAWLVVLEDRKITATPIDDALRAKEFSARSSTETANSFLAFARTRNPSAEYFVIMLKPSAVDQFETVERELRTAKFDLGFDVIGEEQNPSPATTKGS